MKLTPLKKMDIFVERHALGSVEAMLGRVGAKGWSVFAGAEGAGAHGAWRRSGAAATGDMHLIVAIVTPTVAEAALDWLEEFFDAYPGVVAVADVQVMRPERF